MKKILAVCLAACLFISSAFALELERADTGADFAALKNACGYTVDANGDFFATNDKGAALEDLFSERLAAYASAGIVYFRLETHGNVNTGVCYPVLKIVYASQTPLNTRAVSFALNGSRYDFAVSRASQSIGRVRAETLTVFLDSDGLLFVNELSAAAKFGISLMGDGQFTLNAEKRQTYATPRLELAAESAGALTLADGSPDFADYPFFAQANAVYLNKTGIEPEMSKASISEKCAVTLDDEFGLLGDGSRGASVRDVQKLLCDSGFLAGSEGATVTEEMRAAVRRAQARYGMIQTGYADAALINALGTPAQAVREATSELTYECESAEIMFSLDRWWTANAVSTSVPLEIKARASKDNSLIIADGFIKSVHTDALSLSWEVTAEITYAEKWTFPAFLYCETDAGEKLSTTLGILQKSRLICVCEVPEYLLDAPADWKLKISAGDKSFEYELI